MSGDKVDEEPAAATFAANDEVLAAANAFANHNDEALDAVANALAAYDEEPNAVANAFANDDEVLADANALAAYDEELDAVANAFANNDEELAAATALAATKDTHIVPEKNDVKGDKTEEPAVESTTLEAPPSLPLKTVKKVFKNKSTVEVYILRAETEERNVQKQKADDDNTQEPPHHHHQEHARRI